MKKITLTIAALALSAGAAFAGNPNVGTPYNLHANDNTTVMAKSQVQSTQAETYTDGSANGFDDHSPSSTRR